MLLKKVAKWTGVLVLCFLFATPGYPLEMPRFLKDLWPGSKPSQDAPAAEEPAAGAETPEGGGPTQTETGRKGPETGGRGSSDVRIKEIKGGGRKASVVLDQHCPQIVQPYTLSDNTASVVNYAIQQVRNFFAKPGELDLLASVKIAAKQLNWLPMRAEVLYGEKMHAEETDILERDSKPGRQYYPVADKMMAEVLEAVGEPHDYDFKLFILKKNTRNAVARPGGYIYLDQGLVDNPAQRSKAYFALAHEVSHVLERHETKELQSMIIDSIQTRSEIGRILSGVRGDPTVILSYLKMQKDLFTKHHVDQELQSDSCAARVLSRVFPEPKQLAASLAAFLKDLPNATAETIKPPPQTYVEKLAATATGIVNDPISRHPTTQQREDNLRQIHHDIIGKPPAKRP
jgi:Zn-dependent protease with chaperone function